MNVKVTNGQTIFDIALLSGNIENVYTIIQDSGLDVGISSDFTGETLTYTESEQQKKEAVKLENVKQKVVTIRKEQSIFDLSLQYYGSVEKVFDLIQNNSFIDSVVDDEFSKNVLNYTELNTAIPLFFRTNNFILGTNKPRIEFLLTQLGDFINTENDEAIIL